MTQSATPDPTYRPAKAHLQLGDQFFDAVAAASFPKAILRYRNDDAAFSVGLQHLTDDEWIEHFAHFKPLPDNFEEPLALRYHGHQFRSYNPDLGDGRGFLFAQLLDDADRLLDLGTKGSGQTPYSRMGDGRLTLKGGVREILATEMLAALGVNTSASFSLVETGEHLERQDEPSPARSAVLVRLSHSHIRFGTFQYLAYHKRDDDIAKLIEHCTKHYFADLEGEDRTVSFFREVVRRSADLVAGWMAAGFVHGVLNTDNMNITGESFDYGPWRFLPQVSPGFTAAYFDQTGLYAYARQPEAVAWNLAQLGGTLAGHADEEALNDILRDYGDYYQDAMARHFSRRLGVTGLDVEFVSRLLGWMKVSEIPFEQFFFDWFSGEASVDRAAESRAKHLYTSEDWKELEVQLLKCNPTHAERLDSEYFQQTAPCTMLIDEVEAIWERIDQEDDWSALEEKLGKISEIRKAIGG